MLRNVLEIFEPSFCGSEKIPQNSHQISCKITLHLEAQQRYFSYRAMLLAIVSQTHFRACFLWGIAQLSRDTLQNGLSHRCVCAKLSTKGRVSHHFGGVPDLPWKVSRDMGYRSDSIAISRNMGPLRPCKNSQRKSTPDMTGRSFHRTMEMIPARRWSSKSHSTSTSIKQSTKQGIKARYGAELPPSFPLSGTPVV